LAGTNYELVVWNSGQIASVEGGVSQGRQLQIQVPEGAAGSYSQQQITINFGKAR